jgi:membrane protein
MNIQSSKIYRIIFVIYNRFFDDRLTYAASALVYSTLFAIVPLFAVCFGIFSAFPAFHSVSDQVQTFISQNFIPASGAIIQDYIKVFILQATKLSLIGTVFLIIAAMFLLITIEDVFSQIWHVEKRRQTLYAWLSYWAILSLAPILIGISVASSSYIMSLNLVSNILNNFELKQHLLWIFPFAFMLIAFTLLYIVAPNCRVPFRYAFFGAFISTSL